MFMSPTRIRSGLNVLCSEMKVLHSSKKSEVLRPFRSVGGGLYIAHTLVGGVVYVEHTVYTGRG